MQTVRVFFILCTVPLFILPMEPPLPAYKQVHAVSDHAVKDLCFISPNSFAVATYKNGASDVDLYDTKSKKSKLTFSCEGEINSMSQGENYHKIAAAVGNHIAIFDVQTGQRVQTYKAHFQRVNALHSHPSNSHLVVSGSSDKTMRVWDLRSPIAVQVYQAHDDAVTCVRMAGNESYLVSGAKDNTTKIWDWNKPSSLHIIKYVAPKMICYNNEGTKFVTCAHYALRYDAISAALLATFNRNGKQEPSRGSKIEATSSLIYACACTGEKDQELVALGTDDGKMVLFNPDNSKMAPLMLEVFKNRLDMLAFCPNANCLVAGSSVDQKWHVYELSNRKESPRVQKRSSISGTCLP